ncbi:hypothetical protein ON010_g8405 [Phytophthora cinnamomi]|nr:hypothetical protein ON010_g8405 [Phytophthora cinnamomi]
MLVAAATGAWSSSAYLGVPLFVASACNDVGTERHRSPLAGDAPQLLGQEDLTVYDTGTVPCVGGREEIMLAAAAESKEGARHDADASVSHSLLLLYLPILGRLVWSARSEGAS